MTQPATISADYTLRPSELAATLALLVEARQPAMVWGPPGSAKSMIAQQVAADDLLDAGRIDTGTLSVSPEPSEVAVLVDRARTTFLSGGGRHTVTIDLPPDLPRVMADRQRVEQVLNNLLANAARQAPESSPIRIAAERDGMHVAVSVADEGRGIRKQAGLEGVRIHDLRHSCAS